jgi:hypothetical protein
MGIVFHYLLHVVEDLVFGHLLLSEVRHEGEKGVVVPPY